MSLHHYLALVEEALPFQQPSTSHEWVSPRRSSDDDIPVWVDVAKLDASWRKDDAYVGPGSAGGIGRRYRAFGEWLSHGEKVQMPEVTIGAYGWIVFNNGRHRFSWFRDHGATALPVLVPAERADAVRSQFGTLERRTTTD